MSTARESFDWLGILEASTEAFAEVVEHGDPDAPLPHCPGWTLCHLANHLGGVHQWASHAVVAGDPRFDPAATDVRGPAQAGWYREHAGRLIDILRGEHVDVRGSAEVLLRTLWHRTTDDEKGTMDLSGLSLLSGAVTP